MNRACPAARRPVIASQSSHKYSRSAQRRQVQEFLSSGTRNRIAVLQTASIKMLPSSPSSAINDCSACDQQLCCSVAASTIEYCAQFTPVGLAVYATHGRIFDGMHWQSEVLDMCFVTVSYNADTPKNSLKHAPTNSSCCG